MTSEKIVERENWSMKKRTDYANRVVDGMADEEIPNLWRDFNNTMKEARDRKVSLLHSKEW